MRTALLIAMLTGFVGLGVLDIANGHLTTGTASLLLAAVNFLLLAGGG